MSDSSYVLFLFAKELQAQLVKLPRGEDVWRQWITRPFSHVKMKPDEDDVCSFYLGPFGFHTYNASQNDLKHHLVFFYSGRIQVRKPDPLLMTLFWWFHHSDLIDKQTLSCLFGGDTSEQLPEIKSATQALRQFIKAIHQLLYEFDHYDGNNDRSSYVNARNTAVLWYGILQDWVIGRSGSIVLSRLLAI